VFNSEYNPGYGISLDANQFISAGDTTATVKCMAKETRSMQMVMILEGTLDCTKKIHDSIIYKLGNIYTIAIGEMTSFFAMIL
jgi:hypothetical protein